MDNRFFISLEHYASEKNKKDICIIDSETQKFLLLKKAYYVGNANIYTIVTNEYVTTFEAQIFFYTDNIANLQELSDNPKISSIRIFSKDYILSGELDHIRRLIGRMK